MSIQTVVESETRSRSLEFTLSLLRAGPLLILVVLIAVLGMTTPYFLTLRNFSNIASQTAVIAILAIGQHFVILTRGIDLSVGSNLALASVCGALVFRWTDSDVLTPVAMLAAGTCVGLVNGFIYVWGRLPHPFIITLATLSICRGLALELAGGTALSGMPDSIMWLGGSTLGGLPVALFVVVATAVLGVIVAKGLIWGRWMYAVGGNPEAALRTGIPVNFVHLSVYGLCGLTAGIGAVLTAGRTAAGSPIFGNLAELDSIAAVIIGGASFLGGRGHIGHALVGAIMIGVIRNALNLLNINLYVQLIAIGTIIVVAVEADVLRSVLESRFRSLQAAGERS